MEHVKFLLSTSMRNVTRRVFRPLKIKSAQISSLTSINFMYQFTYSLSVAK